MKENNLSLKENNLSSTQRRTPHGVSFSFFFFPSLRAPFSPSERGLGGVLLLFRRICIFLVVVPSARRYLVSSITPHGMRASPIPLQRQLSGILCRCRRPFSNTGFPEETRACAARARVIIFRILGAYHQKERKIRHLMFYHSAIKCHVKITKCNKK